MAEEVEWKCAKTQRIRVIRVKCERRPRSGHVEDGGGDMRQQLKRAVPGIQEESRMVNRCQPFTGTERVMVACSGRIVSGGTTVGTLNMVRDRRSRGIDRIKMEDTNNRLRTKMTEMEGVKGC
jgi:hypothetical protein